MLVLSRLKGEEVLILVAGVEIRVVLVEQRGLKSRIGFDAPAGVVIVRKELIQNEEDRQQWIHKAV